VHVSPISTVSNRLPSFFPAPPVSVRARPPSPTRTFCAQGLNEASEGLPFRTELFEPFLQEAPAARQAPLVDAGDLTGTGLALRLEWLLSARSGRWIAMLPLRGVRDGVALSGALSGPNGVDLIDLKVEADALYRGYRGQACGFHWSARVLSCCSSW